MTSLFNISERQREILDNIGDSELTPEEQEELGKEYLALEGDRNSKVDAIAAIVRETEGRISCIEKEIARLSAIKSKELVKIERVTDLLDGYMAFNEIQEIKTDTNTVKYKKNPPKVVVENWDDLMPEHVVNGYLDAKDSLDMYSELKKQHKKEIRDKAKEEFKVYVKEEIAKADGDKSLEKKIKNNLSGFGYLEIIERATGNITVDVKVVQDKRLSIS